MTIDKTWVGFVFGLVMPIITTLLFFKFAYHGRLPFFDFLAQMMEIRGVGMLLAVSCLPNLAVFTLFAYTDRLKVSRGLFLSTLIYAFAIVIVKFVF
ncbi:MAG: hypothetical protein MR215_10610 [Bacteroidales bacterium]|nr:hypothetical protein [Bacteroidales bacterium]MDY4175000.1 hypothetical protein [Bacteroidales bacterium]